MTLVGRAVRSLPGRTLLVFLVLALAWQAYLSISAPAKVGDGLVAEVDQGEPVQVGVVLGFEPERFHTLFLQDYGRVLRVEGNEVHLRSVRPENIDRLARIYWIERLETLEDPA